jgi:hypothetical protein
MIPSACALRFLTVMRLNAVAVGFVAGNGVQVIDGTSHVTQLIP